jgi:hypothetical protein
MHAARESRIVIVIRMNVTWSIYVACSVENIEYVFGSEKSPIKGTSIIVGELLVLLIRVCMPIHVICSVLQAASLSKVSYTHAFMSMVYMRNTIVHHEDVQMKVDDVFDLRRRSTLWIWEILPFTPLL